MALFVQEPKISGGPPYPPVGPKRSESVHLRFLAPYERGTEEDVVESNEEMSERYVPDYKSETGPLANELSV